MRDSRVLDAVSLLAYIAVQACFTPRVRRVAHAVAGLIRFEEVSSLDRAGRWLQDHLSDGALDLNPMSEGQLFHAVRYWNMT